MTNHIVDLGMWLVCKKTYDGLDEEAQKVS
jgi:TRAP-type C4-dicarboxylate transport system substrate-binding protein